MEPRGTYSYFWKSVFLVKIELILKNGYPDIFSDCNVLTNDILCYIFSTKEIWKKEAKLRD